MERGDVTEVTFNRPGEVWAKTFKGWEQHHRPDVTWEHLEQLMRSIVVFNGMQELAISSVRMPHGERGQIVRPPACQPGMLSLSIRKHSVTVKTLDELAGQGAFANWRDRSFNQPTSEEAAAEAARADFRQLDPAEVELLNLKRNGDIVEFLKAAVRAHRNIVVAGKTGSGKTTLTRSLIDEVPHHERIITIEDVHELFLEKHPNKVHMLYGEGQGRVSADDALKSCMRQSPDRIFLAELRGDEAWEYINSLNTGHPGAITTTHANGALETFERIALLVKKSPIGKQLDLAMIRNTLYSTLHVVLFIHERRLVEVFYDPIFARSKLDAG